MTVTLLLSLIHHINFVGLPGLKLLPPEDFSPALTVAVKFVVLSITVHRIAVLIRHVNLIGRSIHRYRIRIYPCGHLRCRCIGRPVDYRDIIAGVIRHINFVGYRVHRYGIGTVPALTVVVALVAPSITVMLPSIFATYILLVAGFMAIALGPVPALMVVVALVVPSMTVTLALL